MKLVMKAWPLFLAVIIFGCSDDESQSRTKAKILKTQRDALNDAKNVDRVLMQAAESRREEIDKDSE